MVEPQGARQRTGLWQALQKEGHPGGSCNAAATTAASTALTAFRGWVLVLLILRLLRRWWWPGGLGQLAKEEIFVVLYIHGGEEGVG